MSSDVLPENIGPMMTSSVKAEAAEPLADISVVREVGVHPDYVREPALPQNFLRHHPHDLEAELFVDVPCRGVRCKDLQLDHPYPQFGGLGKRGPAHTLAQPDSPVPLDHDDAEYASVPLVKG